MSSGSCSLPSSLTTFNLLSGLASAKPPHILPRAWSAPCSDSPALRISLKTSPKKPEKWNESGKKMKQPKSTDELESPVLYGGWAIFFLSDIEREYALGVFGSNAFRFLQSQTAKFGQSFDNFFYVRWLVSLAAIRNRRGIRRVCFCQNALKRDIFYYFVIHAGNGYNA